MVIRLLPSGIPYCGVKKLAMSSLETMTDEQFERHALEVLRRELGVDGWARFLRLEQSRPGDYTMDRTQWQKDLTIEHILDSIRHRQR
jgi:hypothetical protein